MLTRLKVSGFKNLVDVDVRFGPFTCIAGANATGKSNLFDAIQFLSALADQTLIEAAFSVRGEGGRATDIRNLFHRIGNEYKEQMSFEAEMIIPKEGTDDLGQQAKASITFLRYAVTLAYREDDSLPSRGSLELIREELRHVNLGEAAKRLKFPLVVKTWRKSVLSGRRTSPFIATEVQDDKRIVTLSQDQVSGRPKTFLANTLPRTVLSTVNASESPTALLARREMQSWRLFQLEPSALRQPDDFTVSPRLLDDGGHLAATMDYLNRLSRTGNGSNVPSVYGQIALRLSELIDDVHAITVDRDQKRQLLTIEITNRNGTVLPARSLSDGTLRFLALAVLELDPTARGVICLEEPENGIHPKRIPAMLRLLQDIAVDTELEVGPDNPLRQVIVNTHSPAVVQQVPDDALIVAELREQIDNGQRFKSAAFSWLPRTWRHTADPEIPTVAKGTLMAYLRLAWSELHDEGNNGKGRVVDHPDLQPYLPGLDTL